MLLHVVILAGGRGERFWPLSRRSNPKQLLPLAGSTSLLEATIARARLRVPPERIWLAGSIDHRDAIDRLGLSIPGTQCIWETEARNTAPALGAVAELCRATGGGAMLVLPSDHWIPDADRWWSSIDCGVQALERTPERVVTFGIPVTRPETGYGYIERGEPIAPDAGVFRVRKFHEKPTMESARAYHSGGQHYWNSGIFIFDAAGLTELLRRHEPRLRAPLDELRAAIAHGAAERDWARFFGDAPSISIDYALAERATDVVCVEAGFGWSDVGAWPAWAEQRAADPSGNVRRGEVLAIDTKDCVLYSEDGGLLAVLGVEGLVIVRVGDATLVCPKDRAQEVKRLLEEGRLDARLAEFF